MNKLTSTEIARLAGVSRSTVSRVINGYNNVPDETRELVMKVINENEYYPILSGQMLAGKRTGMIGFFWISESSIADDVQSSAFFAHITEAAASFGYLVLTCIVKNLREEENVQCIKRIFMQERIDAGVFMGLNNSEPLADFLLSKGKIVGIFDHHHPNQEESGRITVNFEQDTGGRVIDYVYRMGHRKIAIIDGNMNRYSCAMRHESFLRGMMLHNIEIRPEWMYYAGINVQSGYQATKRLLQACGGDLPTVICAHNDAVAFGVYDALREVGISIPDQVSVIGMDGHAGGAQLTPPLTTFAFDFRKMFFSLVERTIKTVQSQGDVPLTEFIPGTLVERSSVRRLDVP